MRKAPTRTEQELANLVRVLRYIRPSATVEETETRIREMDKTFAKFSRMERYQAIIKWARARYGVTGDEWGIPSPRYWYIENLARDAYLNGERYAPRPKELS